MERPLRVLIADDRLHSREGLKALLATCSWVEIIGEAGNGEEAVELAKDSQPDVILMDIQMPVMDGLAATRIIKDSLPKVRIIILTIYPSFRLKAKAAGADAILIKGCPTEKLLDTLIGLGE